MKARLKSFVVVATGGTVFFSALNIYKGNEKFYRQVVLPFIQLCDPEDAHKLAVKAAKYGLVPKSRLKKSDILKNKIWGIEFSNPMGVAAGFDKHCEATLGLLKAGFSHIETGTVTPKPQEGNPKPRVFRLVEDEAVINRYGFNSVGHAVFLERLEELTQRNNLEGVVGVSIGKNKESESAVDDYTLGIKTFGCLADYIAINISSPNTPGLRRLQQQKSLDHLIKSIKDVRDSLQCKKALLLVKISPDLNKEGLNDVAQVLMKHKIDGIIISNTTLTRDENLISKHKTETGGLSGPPVKEISTDAIREIFKLTKGTIPIIGVGGIASGQDAYDKIKAGASLLQLYTSMIYHGPSIGDKINEELEELLRLDGYSNISEAIGSESKTNKK